MQCAPDASLGSLPNRGARQVTRDGPSSSQGVAINLLSFLRLNCAVSIGRVMDLGNGGVQWALRQLCDGDMGMALQHDAKFVIRREIRCANGSEGRDLIDEVIGSSPVAGSANKRAQYLLDSCSS